MHGLRFYVNEAILHHNKVKLIPKNFSKNSNLDDSDVSLPAFPSLTDLKLNNILVTPELMKKVTFTLDSTKVSVTDHIPVVVLKKCKPEFSWIYVSKGICFPDCRKVSSVVPVFKSVRERSVAKNYHSVSLLSVIRKVFKIFVNKTGLKKLFVCRHPTSPTLQALA